MLITKLFAYAKVFLVFVDVLVFLGDCNLSQIDTHCLIVHFFRERYDYS